MPRIRSRSGRRPPKAILDVKNRLWTRKACGDGGASPSLTGLPAVGEGVAPHELCYQGSVERRCATFSTSRG